MFLKSWAMSYKTLGDYIQLVNIRNKDLEVTTLLGVSIKKVLMPSIANTIGTNMKTYKIIKQNQFAYGPVTSRNGDKISIALLEEYETAIVSQAYTVFEVIDEQEVLPEYLMMWFRRAEFDRFSRFKSHGSAREVFDWEELCDTRLPIPSIEKQQQIVAEYNTVTKRISLNKQLSQNLEETAQALYKHWFVDFEFPNTENKPYKSSGGLMVYNEELDKYIPVGWKVDDLASFNLDISDGNYSGKYPKSSEFLNKGVPFIRGTDFNGFYISPFNLRYISKEKHSQLLKGHTKKGDVLMTTRGASIGKYAYVSDDYIDVNINSQLVRLNGDNNYPQFYLGLLFSSREFFEVLEGAITGSAQPQLSITNLIGMRLSKPRINIIKSFCEKFNSIHKNSLLIFKQNIVLEEGENVLLSKMTQVSLKTQAV
jgi:type I restriction enzyme S subunit